MKTVRATTLRTTTLILLLMSPLTNGMANENSSVGGYVSGDFRLNGNYVWRGLTLSNNKASVSHSLSYTFEVGAYVGYWASNVELVDTNDVLDNGVEIDFFAGYKTMFDEQEGYGLDFGILHYYYDLEHAYIHNELFITVQLTDFALSYYHAGGDRPADYYELSWSYELDAEGLVTLSMVAGYTQFKYLKESSDELDTYNYLIAISFYFGRSGDLTLSYSGATRNLRQYGLASVANLANAADNRFFLSWGISF